MMGRLDSDVVEELSQLIFEFCEEADIDTDKLLVILALSDVPAERREVFSKTIAYALDTLEENFAGPSGAAAH